MDGLFKGRRLPRYLAASVLVVALVSALFAIPAGRAQGATPGDFYIQRFFHVYQLIRQLYLRDVPPEKLLDGALKGMASSLDPWSAYFGPDELKGFMSQVQGKYGGIGVQIDFRDGYTTVVAPFPGSPGERAGLQPGDHILAVDGKDVKGQQPETVSPLIKGDPGTKVRLAIQRGNPPARFDVEVTRELIVMRSVDSRMLTSKIGYLRITSFAEDTSQAVREALASLKAAGARGVVVDVRDNPGGLLNSALAVTRQFVSEGPILIIMGRQGWLQTVYSKTPGTDLKMAVLVNGRTASAAEIFAGAVQDRGAGLLGGERTYGKGYVQSVIDVEGGGALKLTTARYLTPNAQELTPGHGLDPDVPVVPPEPPALRQLGASTHLERGSIGLDAQALQERLAAFGFDPGAADGVFGWHTEEALRGFQRSKGLEPTGVIDGNTDPATLAAINSAPPRADVQLQKAQEVVEERLR